MNIISALTYLLVVNTFSISLKNFPSNPKSSFEKYNGQLFIYITDTEWDKAYDEPGKNGYVNLVTDIITVNCEMSDRNAVSQYIDHYNAQERTKTRDRVFNVTNAWSYRTYDEAYRKRREWMAKFNQNDRKRTIAHLYLTCK